MDESAAKDNDKKGDKLAMLPNGTAFIVIDEATGHQFEWMQVIVEGYEKQKTYVYKKFTEKLESTKESAEIKFSDKAVSVENQQATDWTHKESSSVWFEKKTASWCVVVETEHKSTGGAQLTTRMNDAVDFGLWRILSENSKKAGARLMKIPMHNQKTRIARQIYFCKSSGLVSLPTTRFKLKDSCCPSSQILRPSRQDARSRDCANT